MFKNIMWVVSFPIRIRCDSISSVNDFGSTVELFISVINIFLKGAFETYGNSFRSGWLVIKLT